MKDKIKTNNEDQDSISSNLMGSSTYDICEELGKMFFDNQRVKNLNTEIVWLTTKTAAQFLGISEKSLLNLVSNGKVPYSKLGRRNRYLKSDLHGLLLTNKRGAFHGN